MALPTNTFPTYTAIGNREDLSDEIYNVDPTETPFFSAIEKVSSSAVKHEWQTQALDSRNTANAVLEGDDAAAIAVVPTARLDNQHQISRKVNSVSATQQVVDHAGRGSELTYQKMLRAKELKLDVDAILCGTNQAKNTGGLGTARLTASILSWIKTNNSSGATGSAPSTADGAATRTDGTQRAFTEVLLKGVLKSIADAANGSPDMILLGTFNKQQFSTFTGRATPMEETKSKSIIATVDYYRGDFGEQKVVFSRQMRTRDCLVLKTNMWAVANLPNRKMVSTDLAVTGDSTKFQIITEYCLEARNEKASGIVADLTTS
jgi:hypothetical protein